jgi:hypothetical protein
MPVHGYFQPFLHQDGILNGIQAHSWLSQEYLLKFWEIEICSMTE